MKPEILIPTCDSYIHMVEATMISCRELWPAGYTFRILGYKEPEFKLDDNWFFEKIGDKDTGPQCWGTDIWLYLKLYKHEHFIYGNDDCALTFMNFNLLETAIRYTVDGPLVGRFALMADGKEWSSKHLDTGIVTFKNDMPYRISLGWSIYKKEFFLEFLQFDMTPWAFEKQSCGDVDTSAWLVCGYTPKAALDAAFFCRRNKGIIEDWHKGYFGHDLTGELYDTVKSIIFKK